ncbi:hypothetical protein ACFQUX_29190 [Pantoea stewartii]
MAFFVPSHNAVYDRATQLDDQWVTLREEKTLETLRRLYPDAELIPRLRYRKSRITAIAVGGNYRSPLYRPDGNTAASGLVQRVWRGVVQIDGIYGRGCDRNFCPVRRAFL